MFVHHYLKANLPPLFVRTMNEDISHYTVIQWSCWLLISGGCVWTDYLCHADKGRYSCILYFLTLTISG